MPITEPRLYAVVDNSLAKRKTPAKRKTKPELLEQKNAEFQLKHHIDQADRVLSRHENRIAEITKQIARLQKTKAHLVARQERIADRILERMQDHNMTLAAGWKITFKANPCPASVEVENEKLIPRAYLRAKTVESPDKVLIGRVLKEGFLIVNGDLLPPQFRAGSIPNEASIKEAVTEGIEIPGVEPVASIPGVRLVQRISLQRK